ncbi:MAG TPA: CAP domain-containing protein [Candidatus Elarobacter sp.]|nr:CAP domain-containing protein [Candidatus Elarobacter sp.]
MVASLAAALTTASCAVRPHAMVSQSSTGDRPIAIALVGNNPHVLSLDAEALASGVNAERAKRGLRALQRDPGLDRIANAKAIDMVARGYFGHTDPSGVTFEERMRGWHWPSQYVAENIAFDSSEPNAQRAFLNSPPHLANLIDPHEQRIGVAVVTVGSGETFYVEDFSN